MRYINNGNTQIKVSQFAPLSYSEQVYAPCRWELSEKTSVKTNISIEYDAYITYPDEWTIKIEICELGTWPFGGWKIALASTWYKDCGGKTGPVILNCSSSNPTGSGLIYSGDGGTWQGGRCDQQTGRTPDFYKLIKNIKQLDS
jgi:hypothetical protein